MKFEKPRAVAFMGVLRVSGRVLAAARHLVDVPVGVGLVAVLPAGRTTAAAPGVVVPVAPHDVVASGRRRGQRALVRRAERGPQVRPLGPASAVLGMKRRDPFVAERAGRVLARRVVARRVRRAVGACDARVALDALLRGATEMVFIIVKNTLQTPLKIK